MQLGQDIRKTSGERAQLGQDIRQTSEEQEQLGQDIRKTAEELAQLGQDRKMAQTESKDHKLRKRLREESYAKFFVDEFVMYVPTRTITVTSKDPEVTAFSRRYLWTALKKLNVAGAVRHMDPTDKSCTKWEVTYQSEEEMEQHFQTFKAAEEANETSLVPHEPPRTKGSITLSGLPPHYIAKALDYFQAYVRNPIVDSEFDSKEGLTKINHDGIKKAIKTNVDIGRNPYPEVVRTDQQSRHVIDALEEVEWRCLKCTSTFYIKRGLIAHSCARKECMACDEIY